MPIKVNNVEITTNKINNNNVSEEKLNGTKIYPSTVYYTVRFYDYSGGSLLKTQQVQQGSNATAPANPTRTGYTFTGWDKDFSNITSNLDIYGTWQQAGSFETKYAIIDVGDWSYLINNYEINFAPYAEDNRIMGTHAQAILEETWDTGTADYVSTNTSFHTDYPLMAPQPSSAIGAHIAICIDDPNYYVSNGYFFILYEVVSA